MNIYKISQDENNNSDSFDSAIVVAESFDQAEKIHPTLQGLWPDWIDDQQTWISNPQYVKLELIGKADEKYQVPQVILASFNAG